MKLSELKVNPNNPRLIKDEKFKKLCQSLRDFPEMMELRPIIVDENFIIQGGNMRYNGLVEIGYKEIPDSWVRQRKDFTPEQWREFIIKDNVGFGEWDFDMLANEWDTDLLEQWGVDLPVDFGDQPEATEDDYNPPAQIETDIVPGDLFEIGPHRLMCGDSTNADDVGKLMGGEKIDMVFTDPPYGVSIGAKNRMLNSFQPSGRNLADIQDDSLSDKDLYSKLLLSFTILKQNLRESASVYVCAPQGGNLGLMMMMMMKDAGLGVKHVLNWVKNAPTFSMGRLDYEYQHEPILYTWNKNHVFYGNGEHKSSIWKVDKPRSNKEHPTMKPVKLVENALLNSSKEGDIVCDIYLGSGTTMVAAHQLNRRCFGMEIAPHYCQVIIDRMLKLDPQIIIKKNGIILD